MLRQLFHAGVHCTKHPHSQQHTQHSLRGMIKGGISQTFHKTLNNAENSGLVFKNPQTKASAKAAKIEHELETQIFRQSQQLHNARRCIKKALYVRGFSALVTNCYPFV